MARVITISSGSKATGSSTVARALGQSLAAQQQQVCLLELANPSDTPGLHEYVTAQADAASIVTPVMPFLDRISGSRRDPRWLRTITAEQLSRLAECIAGLNHYAVILVDAGCSSAQGVLGFALASPELLFVVNGTAQALSDGYSQLKLLYSEQYAGQVSVIVNLSKNHTDGRHSYKKFKEVVNFYLSLPLPLAGLISEHPALRDSAADADFNAIPEFAAEIRQITDYLLSKDEPQLQVGLTSFARDYLELSAPNHVHEHSMPPMSASDRHRASGELHVQLDGLSQRVDQLIAAVEQLRVADTERDAELFQLPPPQSQPARQRCAEDCLANMASHTESVRVQGDIFTIYQLRRPDGGVQHFAWQDMDDDQEAPEPQSTHS
jgi:MinD-like ATPase involved in chromosome partitioning or flagellar assembly